MQLSTDKKRPAGTKPIRLKQALIDCGISQRAFGRMSGLGTFAVNGAVNGELPPRAGGKYKAAIERIAAENRQLARWLVARDLTPADLWDELPADNAPGPSARPAGMAERMACAQRAGYAPGRGAVIVGDPLQIKQPHEEALMIDPQARKHFKMFRDPFINDISDSRDIFFSEDHRFLMEMMLQTARFAGFTAVTGEVGSGKSVMRKAVVQELISEDIRVVFPIIVDKSRITPGSLIDAIIMDISEEKPKRSLEQKTRQALKLLRNRATSGMKQVLIIEEAHLMNVPAMKALKQIYELEDGYSRLIGIILIGQPELKFLLDETRHPEMREVSRRVTCAEIAGLDRDLARYVSHKFARVKKDPSDVFGEGAFEAMARRLTSPNGRGEQVSKAYPLTINNLAARAMNMAVEMGESKVTEEVVMAL